MNEWAEILAEAMNFFGKPYPRQRNDRQALLPERERRPGKDWDPFYQLNRRFYEWTDNWEDAANAFAEPLVRIPKRTATKRPRGGKSR